ncbi:MULTISPECIES: M55 family metallopeptidase [unclassified Sedimentibacter]|uniref:M55 family metallopeptidase n=1 Tax=unclassified Sedimentibacter TaxID=2649220 RepID=UPI0027DFC695|nr:M55 family metallopeptidase [Sedimentibacter sp. MB35-C1]WMJ77152.1 M55 family metallopeptidase [Sedimentibacter sp. MB35-C1]
MKVFISVDIEGITGVTSWSETTLGNSDYAQSADQMTKETVAACEGAIAMGAKEIFIKDAHDSARNIDITKLPRCAKLSRGWTNTPDSMVAGIDETFDAAIFIGYHSGAGTDGSPLAHTMNLGNNYIKINGERASEFVINSYLAAAYGVPVVFLSGDKMLCEKAKEFNKSIETLAVKEGNGGAAISINPDLACDLIKEGVKNGLKRVGACKIEMPEKFEVEINYKEHKDAKHASFYPGVEQADSHTVKYTSDSIEEFAVTKMFIL